ncbi:hypothetical protein OHV05_36575 (plasmid) [Kitasatospora sp. NBC_00070]|uniref:Rv1733c family protein n=1 Tax=Kitasatospora sp. NBC_00070 TaxID=2975962 RepID=UPI0032456115
MTGLLGWSSRWLRLLRAPSPGRNALYRPVDRARHRLTLLLLGLLALAVAASVATAAVVLRSAHAEAQAAAAHLRPVAAVVLSAPEAPPGPAVSPGPVPGHGRAQVSWTALSGRPVTALVFVAIGTQPGATIGLWVNDADVPTHAPRTDAELRIGAFTVGVGVMIGLSLFLAALHMVAAHHLQHHAEALWEAEWERVEPWWSGRTPGPPG